MMEQSLHNNNNNSFNCLHAGNMNMSMNPHMTSHHHHYGQDMGSSHHQMNHHSLMYLSQHHQYEPPWKHYDPFACRHHNANTSMPDYSKVVPTAQPHPQPVANAAMAVDLNVDPMPLPPPPKPPRVKKQRPSKTGVKRKPRNKIAQPDTWHRNIVKRLRMSGQEYVNRRGHVVEKKHPRETDCSKCRFRCDGNFSDSRRQKLCEEFWDMGDTFKQKVFLSSCIKSVPIKRRKKGEHITRHRSTAREFYLTNEEGKARVCLKFLCSTLSISHRIVELVVRDISDDGIYVGTDRRKGAKKTKKKKTGEGDPSTSTTTATATGTPTTITSTISSSPLTSTTTTTTTSPAMTTPVSPPAAANSMSSSSDDIGSEVDFINSPFSVAAFPSKNASLPRPSVSTRHSCARAAATIAAARITIAALDEQAADAAKNSKAKQLASAQAAKAPAPNPAAAKAAASVAAKALPARPVVPGPKPGVPATSNHATPPSKPVPVPAPVVGKVAVAVAQKAPVPTSVTPGSASKLDGGPEEKWTGSGPRPKRPKRSKVAQPDTWTRNVRKKLRLSGQEYVNRRGNLVEKKEPRPADCSTCRFHCNDHFPEEARIVLCQEYWAMADATKQKVFISNCVKNIPIKRHKKGCDQSKLRSVARMFFLTHEDVRKRVCLKFFCTTFAISHRTVELCLKNTNEEGIYDGCDRRQLKKVAPNKTSDASVTSVKEHIDSFPFVVCHYCRSSTEKQYLPSELNIQAMHRLYKREYCPKRNLEPVSVYIYSQIFHNYTPPLRFFKPKKEQCPLCNAYDAFFNQQVRERHEVLKKQDLQQELKQQQQQPLPQQQPPQQPQLLPTGVDFD